MRSIRLVTALLLLVPFVSLGAPAAMAAGPSWPNPLDSIVSVDSVPSGLTVRVNGTPMVTPVILACPTGGSLDVNATTPQGSGVTRYVFANWTDGGTIPRRTILCDAPENVTALFVTEHRIRIDVVPRGPDLSVDNSTIAVPATVWCAAGSQLAVSVPTAWEIPGERRTFTNWSDFVGTAGRVVTCDAPADLTAFYLVQFRITLFTSPDNLSLWLDGVPVTAPHSFWCDEGSDRGLDAPFTQDRFGTAWRFVRWEDGESSATRRITCSRTFNVTALYVETQISTPDGPPVANFPVVTMVALLAFIFAVGVPLLVLVVTGRRRAVAPAFPGPVPAIGPAAAVPSRTACAACGHPLEPGWMYCNECGADVR